MSGRRIRSKTSKIDGGVTDVRLRTDEDPDETSNHLLVIMNVRLNGHRIITEEYEFSVIRGQY